MEVNLRPGLGALAHQQQIPAHQVGDDADQDDSLPSFKARAEQVGGTLSVRSGPSGTELTLEVPA